MAKKKEEEERTVKNFFFFFQAEDGIRDSPVTGVQTCALPISSKEVAFELEATHEALLGRVTGLSCEVIVNSSGEIGRASCRERV